MLHVIIIPHRRRVPFLDACLRRLHAALDATASEAAGLWNISAEILLVQAGPREELAGVAGVDHPRVTVLHELQDAHRVFNKSRALNLGIAEALRRGSDVLTFLDGDMLVGSRWPLAAARAHWPGLTRLCYRVRQLGPVATGLILSAGGDPEAAFGRYDEHPLCYEAWGTPDGIGQRPGAQPFGNSQYSISARALGDDRFDEAYIGRGFEDLDLIKRLWLRDRGAYRARIETDADYGLLHLSHGYEGDWRNDATQGRRNRRRYQALDLGAPLE